ncbi:M24 family metallopeptidase [Spirochaeta isovalerica]|uniref:Methionyl aminopeptidase n=1 Tax=Spirochaeta isovalerica TaxID=150 RepID=A0A841R7T8_9SPIO|nr:M24 family metallopeptidase [Spirochaeta isovalerica]MBB6479100.1 methionyl aminopeptidase [Spirochaeta isovalerica]
MRDISLCTGPSREEHERGEISYYSREERFYISQAAALVRDLLRQLEKIIKPGVNELDIDIFCENYILLRNGDPFLKSSGLYEYSALISRNNKAYHGIPENYVLREGDIVTVDIVLRKDGWYGDGAETYPVGNCPPEIMDIVRFSKEIVFDSVKILEQKQDLDVLGDFISEKSREIGLRVLQEGAGHGIGRELHESPLVQYVTSGRSCPLKPGMVFTLEPVFTNCPYDIFYDELGTAMVREGFVASQFEYTVAVQEEGLEILV